MPGLRELQRVFRDALLADEATQLAPWLTQPDAGRRLGIYRNTVFTNLRETLRTLYPVIERLVGADFFNYTAEHYIARYPSPAGDLNRFGAHLADFLNDFEPAAGLPYLPDTARLEWHAHEAYHSAVHAPLAAHRLARVPVEHYETLRFTLHPGARLFSSIYPVHRIWQVNQAGYEGDAQVNLDSGAVRLLIERRARRIEIQVLGAGEWALLQALRDRLSLTEAADAANAAEADFELAPVLSRLIAQATLVDFTLE